MADYKKSIDRLNQLSVQPLTPPLTTPPDSPTPSGKQHETPSGSIIDIILAELHNRRKGRPQQDLEWWCVQLSLDELDSLEARIQADEDLHGFVSDKVKYDYFPRFSRFVLRMAHDLHEIVLRDLERRITQQLSLIAQADDQPAANFARKVIATGSPRITLQDRERHCPDGSFRHKNASDPGVIIEVSHSQKRKDLPFLADDYILGSNGIIQVVIGIDLEYQKKKGVKRKVFVWRPRFVEREGVIELEAFETFEGTFGAEDGSLVDGNKVLRIQLQDFGNKYAYPGIEGITGEIAIPFSELYDIARSGKEIAETTGHKRERDEVNRLNIRKRARRRSPPEELRCEGEERFQEQEEEVQQRLSEQDGDYTPSKK